MSKEKVGFIGLGAMGEPMCGHILSAGYSVSSCANRSREALERLSISGLNEVDSPKEVAAASDILITIVFDEAQTDQVLKGPDGAIEHLQPGATIVIMSTLSPQYCQSLATEVEERGIRVVDCPVSGLVSGAKAGTLTLMAGGTAEVVEELTPMLSSMGTVMLCGGVGAGQAVKLGNNAISLGTYSLIQEVRDTVASAGVDLETFMQILNQSTGRSFVSEVFPMPEKRMPHRAMPAKDISLCLGVADANNITMPMLQACYDAGI